MLITLSTIVISTVCCFVMFYECCWTCIFLNIINWKRKYNCSLVICHKTSNLHRATEFEGEYLLTASCVFVSNVFLFQSCSDDKVIRFKKAVEYYSMASKPPHFPPHLGEFPSDCALRSWEPSICHGFNLQLCFVCLHACTLKHIEKMQSLSLTVRLHQIVKSFPMLAR